MTSALHVGLLVNPLAGLGGSLALKGSDSSELRALAEGLPLEQRRRAHARTLRALNMLGDQLHRIQFTCSAGNMGEAVLQELGLDSAVVGSASVGLTSASDTRAAVAAMLESGVDIIVFAGGDGTARDICDVVGLRCPVLGIPAGVKMHSAVFAVSPEAAGELLRCITEGGLVSLKMAEVRDIDEEAFRNDVVRSRFYGELLVPGEGHYLQHTKVGGREDPELAAADIGAWLSENMEPGRTYLIGPGSTTAALMAALGLPNTLLGVDVVCDGSVVSADANEESLLRALKEAAGPGSIVVTAIGGQGHLFGRGNQQFSPAVIRAIGLDNIIIVAARSKLAGLAGRPLLVDTNDTALDLALRGLRAVVTGYDERVLYRVDTQ